jgi:hypothetical protein
LRLPPRAVKCRYRFATEAEHGLTETDALPNRTGTMIRILTVKDILNEQIAKKAV